MARPQKTGLDYFPVDCHLDKNMKAIVRKFGAEGFGVAIGLFQHIYSEGYYVDWCDESQEDFALEINVNEDVLDSIIKFCIGRGIFNKSLFGSEKVLTSRGIQKRYLKAIERRKCEHISLYNLINVDDNALQQELMHTETPLNGINDNNSTQSKVKNSKEENSKEENSKEENTIYSFEQFYSDYEKKVDKKKTELKYSKIKEADRELIKNHLPLYVESTPVKQFRKSPLVYLSGEHWNDEIIADSKNEQQKPNCKLIEKAMSYGDLDI